MTDLVSNDAYAIRAELANIFELRRAQLGRAFSTANDLYYQDFLASIIMEKIVNEAEAPAVEPASARQTSPERQRLVPGDAAALATDSLTVEKP